MSTSLYTSSSGTGSGKVILSSGGTSTVFSPIGTSTTVNQPVVFTKEGSIIIQDPATGEETDVGKATRMFMWWMQTYNPKAIEEFNAIEDIKRKP